MLLALAALGCTCGSRQPEKSATKEGGAAVAPSGIRELEPLSAESWRIELAVPGFEAASLSVPLGAREPRPVVIALHGIADLAEWQCGTWTGISRGRAFVLCPRGIRRDGRETWGELARTERELRAALAALKRRFGEHVAAGSVVLAGYSLGAAHAARLVQQEPSFFSRLVLVEGGHEPLTAAVAAVFARGGGQRVLFACGQRACEAEAQRRLVYLRRAGVDAELVMALEVGHALDGRMAEAIARRWEWLVSGDPRFAPGRR
jgi:pimeloyl-ACP methyl ester carboxylesterase